MLFFMRTEYDNRKNSPASPGSVIMMWSKATTRDLRRTLSTDQQSITPPITDKPADRVDVSHSLSRFTQISHNDIDSEKVQRLRSAIAEGTYHVDAANIADRLLATFMGDHDA